MGDRDKIFKMFFSDEAMVIGLLRGFLGPDSLKSLDFTSLEKVNGSYVTDDVRERFDDIVWKIKYDKEWFYLYILLEFQSTIDKHMAVRILTYVGLLYQDLIKSNVAGVKDTKRLPPILPIVIYDGKPNWNAASEVSDLIYKTTPELDKHIPHLEYVIIDIGSFAQEEIEKLPSSVGSVFDVVRSKDIEDLKAKFIKHDKWFQAPGQEKTRRTILVWLNKILKKSISNKDKFVELTDFKEVGSMLSDAYKWPEEWMNKGLQEGLQKGLQKGKLEGLQEGLQKGLQEGLQKGKLEGKLEGLQEGLQEGQEKTFEKIVFAMHRQGFSAEKIATFIEQPLEKVEAAISRKNTQVNEDISEYNATKKSKASKNTKKKD